MPVKLLGTDGVNQCGSVRSSAGCRYIVPVLLPGAYRTGTIGRGTTILAHTAPIEGPLYCTPTYYGCMSIGKYRRFDYFSRETQKKGPGWTNTPVFQVRPFSGGGDTCAHVMHGRSRMPIEPPPHPYNAGTEHVGFSPTKQTYFGGEFSLTNIK